MGLKVKKAVRVVLILVAVVISLFVILYVSYVGAGLLAENKCEKISLGLVKYETRELNREKVEKDILKGFGKKKLTDTKKMSSLTIIPVDKYKKEKTQIEVVGYNKYFVRCFEVIYDKNGNVLEFIPTYH